MANNSLALQCALCLYHRVIQSKSFHCSVPCNAETDTPASGTRCPAEFAFSVWDTWLWPRAATHRSWKSNSRPSYFTVCSVELGTPQRLLHQLELNHCWIIRLKYKPPMWLVVWALSHWQMFLCCLKHFSKIPIWDCFYSKESDKPPTSQPIIVAAHAVLRNIKMQIPLWWRSQWWHFVVLQRFIQLHGCPNVLL